MRTQAIFLDLDGTLLDYDKATWTETVRAVARRLSQPAGDPRVTSALVGTSKVSQVDDNVAALKNLKFTAEELRAIDGALAGRQPAA